MHKKLQQAIDQIGSQSALARAIGVTPQAVQQWLENGRIPAKRVVAIEAATGGTVKRSDLLPELYGPAPPAPQEAAA
jgi:DNA-binding transcriptional regulator YdaS (Cro superfamily)